ncbi:glycosyltransferase family 39 protein [Streptomyces sp. NPDC053755]|uniref:glycosyltransferase family 39 protein n=1 Tax=Streptomyces sp. NPDC053755 TaxID=3155815 RepID=UPI003429A0C4
MTSTEPRAGVLPPASRPPGGPAYSVPSPPEAAWSTAGGPRRRWIARAVLLTVLALQAALALRLENTAHQDEALFLSAGHAQLAHLLHGTEMPTDHGSHLSGSPVLYPALAALVDEWFGLTGARLLSLLSMLGATTLLYALTRRLFNERAALAAAALYAVTQSTIVLGNFATNDAPAVFLLALTAWIVVRTARAHPAMVLLAAPAAALAVVTNHASALYLPTLVLLAALVSWPHRGRAGLVRAALFAPATGGLLVAGLRWTGLFDGAPATTTARPDGTDTALDLLAKSAGWGGLLFLTACFGAVAYARRGRMNESPRARLSGVPGRAWRVSLGLVLCGTALLAPACQIHLAAHVALYKHLGFGLLFAAPMAGVGLTRLVGAHVRHPQLACGLWVLTLCLGAAQSAERFVSWPESDRLAASLRQYVTPGAGRYLASQPHVPVYYLRDITDQARWTSLHGIGYRDAGGALHTGADGHREALDDGWFDLVVLDGRTRMDAIVTEALKDSGRYRLLGVVPYRLGGGPGDYRIWVKR